MNSASPIPIGITGSTGALGGMVARHLTADGIPQQLLVRTPARAPKLAGSVVRRMSYGDSAAARTALEGIELLFMVSASESSDRVEQHRTFLDAAADAGVRHVVYTSFLGAAPDAAFTLARDHFATEEHLRGSGMAFTFLRNATYLDFMEALAGEDGVIRGPAGDGRVAAVARADVARAAAAVLSDPRAHAGLTYNLTGPEALTLTEVAQVLSAARGRDITFHNETVEEAWASRRQWNAPDWQVDAWVSTYTAIAAGEMGLVSGDVERITGRRPVSLAEFLLG